MKLFKSDKSIMERARDLQHRIESRQQRVGMGKYGRVFKMTRKPTNEEFSRTSMITGIGILAIGGLGFVIFLLATQVAPWIAKELGLIH